MYDYANYDVATPKNILSVTYNGLPFTYVFRGHFTPFIYIL